MASVDKIYGTRKQHLELKDWLQGFDEMMLEYLSDPDLQKSKTIVISSFPQAMDEVLWIHCPLKWVKKRLMEQYNITAKAKSVYY